MVTTWLWKGWNSGTPWLFPVRKRFIYKWWIFHVYKWWLYYDMYMRWRETQLFQKVVFAVISSWFISFYIPMKYQNVTAPFSFIIGFCPSVVGRYLYSWFESRWTYDFVLTKTTECIVPQGLDTYYHYLVT